MRITFKNIVQFRSAPEQLLKNPVNFTVHVTERIIDVDGELRQDTMKWLTEQDIKVNVFWPHTKGQ